MEQATTEPAAQPPRLQIRWWHVVLVVLAAVVLIGVITEAVKPPHGVGTASGSQPNNFTVSVTSSTEGHADIDLNHNGRWSEMNDQRLPWSETLGFGIVSVAVQKGGSVDGSITCTIKNPDGSVRDTQTRTGPYAEVACNTNAGNSGTTGSSGNSGTSGNS